MRAVVAMSGGVDSSVAALLSVRAGYEVVGVALQLWDHSQVDENLFGTCCSPDDLHDARRVCDDLGIPFYVIDSQSDFREKVVDGFIASYSRGLTPSPCIHCNNRVKFARLLDLADEFGGARLVTGHYARIEGREHGGFRLLRGIDRRKDQSYFLFNLSQDDLARIDFPLGGLFKQDVRELARKHGLPTASKHESQELCFVPDGDYAAFLEKEGLEARPGEIVNEKGEIMGYHKGIHRYTIGQRRGLGIAAPHPLFVLDLDHARNRVIVGENKRVFSSSLVARNVCWVNGNPEKEVQARIRYGAEPAAARVRDLGDGSWKVEFRKPQRAVTPGQAVVFYRDEEVVGGGWIERDDRADIQEAHHGKDGQVVFEV